MHAAANDNHGVATAYNMRATDLSFYETMGQLVAQTAYLLVGGLSAESSGLSAVTIGLSLTTCIKVADGLSTFRSMTHKKAAKTNAFRIALCALIPGAQFGARLISDRTGTFHYDEPNYTMDDDYRWSLERPKKTPSDQDDIYWGPK